MNISFALRIGKYLNQFLTSLLWPETVSHLMERLILRILNDLKKLFSLEKPVCYLL